MRFDIATGQDGFDHVAAASSAETYVAVPNHQHALEQAAQTAMLCPDMRKVSTL